jgi:hypothetical protein
MIELTTNSPLFLLTNSAPISTTLLSRLTARPIDAQHKLPFSWTHHKSQSSALKWHIHPLVPTSPTEASPFPIPTSPWSLAPSLLMPEICQLQKELYADAKTTPSLPPLVGVIMVIWFLSWQIHNMLSLLPSHMACPSTLVPNPYTGPAMPLGVPDHQS